MKRPFTLFGLLAIFILTGLTPVASAYDFSAENADGVTIYYNITDANAKTVSVTYGDNGEYDYTNEVVIPSTVTNGSTTYSVTSIGEYAFTYCSGLTSVTIPDSVTEIDYVAFALCTGLTTITIPNSVTEIGQQAFHGCSGLTSVTIPDSVTSIGNYAFSGCTGLTSVTIPDSVTSIGMYAFQGCTGLSAPMYNRTVFVYMPQSYSGAYSIPEGITAIAPGAFVDSSLSSVTIPNSVTYIGGWAFSGCTGLTSVTIPDSVTEIGEYAFYNTGIYNNESNWEDNVLYISNCLIEANNISGAYTIKDNTRLISDYAFISCDGLTSVAIPDSVAEIGFAAFAYCNSMEDLVIGKSVNNIADYAFYECKSLKTITSYNPEPPVMSDKVGFTEDNYCDVNVYVHKGSFSAYTQANVWKNFQNINVLTGIENVEAETTEVDGVHPVYNLQGVCIARNATDDDLRNLPAGLYIFGGKKILVK